MLSIIVLFLQEATKNIKTLKNPAVKQPRQRPSVRDSTSKFMLLQNNFVPFNFLKLCDFLVFIVLSKCEYFYPPESAS